MGFFFLSCWRELGLFLLLGGVLAAATTQLVLVHHQQAPPMADLAGFILSVEELAKGCQWQRRIAKL
jgi:hypothetical protein